MSAQIESLNTYLAEKKKALASDRILHFVLGNEASDLDSMVSSVMYAYHAGQARADENGPVVLPLINIPRADFKLRREAAYLFESTGVDLQNLRVCDLHIRSVTYEDSLFLLLLFRIEDCKEQNEASIKDYRFIYHFVTPEQDRIYKCKDET